MNPHRPFSVEMTHHSLSQLAQLHGSTWGLEAVRDLEWITESRDRFKVENMHSAESLQALLDDGRADGFPPELRSGQNLYDALQVHATHPVTSVLHGDTHTGNLYLDPEGRPCFFDWETIQVGNWAQDVSYHISAVLKIEDRRAAEKELVGHYLSELAINGGPSIAFDEGFDLYQRSLTLGYYFWVITVIRGRDEVLAHIPRLAAAVEDNDTYHRLGVI